MKFNRFAFSLALGTELLLAGCVTQHDPLQFSNSSAQSTEEKPIIVRRKKYATGIGSDSRIARRQQAKIQGIKGVQVKYEPYSRIGNTDYTLNGDFYEIWTDIEDYQEIGIASWYGPGFHGERTSNGEVYDQKGISAAHKNLPLPSYVKVTNLDNNRTLIVRVNDRGPFHEGRIIDLSEGAAKILGVVEHGTARVKLELIKVPEPANAKELYAKEHSRYIQVVASNDQKKANELVKDLCRKLSKTSKEVFVKEYTGLYKVYLGPYLPNRAQRELEKIKSVGYPEAYLLYLD